MNSKAIIFAACAMGLSGTAGADLNTGLKAFWSFDDCTAKDTSGNGYDGTTDAGVTCVGGIVNEGFHFDNGIVTTTLQNQPGTWTLAAWVKPSAVGDYPFGQFPGYGVGNSVVNSNYPGYYGVGFGIDSDELRIIYNNDFLSYPQVFKANAWYHVAVIFDIAKGSVSGFVNGRRVGTTPVSFSASGIHWNFAIGNNPANGDWGFPFAGNIDEVRIYGRALPTAEIKSMYYRIRGTSPWKTSHTVACHNDTQNTQASLPAGRASAWDCESTGLGFNSGDSVTVVIQGKKSSIANPPAIQGVAPWKTSHAVACHNDTLGTVATIPATTQPAWDCEAAGLQINPGDTVTVTITGKKY